MLDDSDIDADKLTFKIKFAFIDDDSSIDTAIATSPCSVSTACRSEVDSIDADKRKSAVKLACTDDCVSTSADSFSLRDILPATEEVAVMAVSNDLVSLRSLTKSDTSSTEALNGLLPNNLESKLDVTPMADDTDFVVLSSVVTSLTSVISADTDIFFDRVVSTEEVTSILAVKGLAARSSAVTDVLADMLALKEAVCSAALPHKYDPHL